MSTKAVRFAPGPAVLGNIKLKLKILLGFAAVLALLGIVGATGYLSLTEVASGIEDLRNNAAIQTAAMEIETKIVELRRHGREFLFTGNEAELEALREGEGEFRSAVEQAQTIIRDSEQATKAEEIGEKFEAWIAAFNRGVELKHEQEKVFKEVLDATGPVMTEHLKELAAEAARAGNSDAAILAGVALQQAMEARLYVSILLGRHDTSAKEKAEEAFAGLSTVLAQLEKSGGALAATVQEVRSEAEAYHEGATRVEQISGEINELLSKTMKNLGAVINDNATAIVALAVEDAKASASGAIELSSTSSMIALVVALGGLGVGVLLAWLIGRGIANPIIGMTGAMTKLANGDLEVAIPALEKRDEIGAMAKAVQVFKENAIEKRKLDEAANAAGEEIAQLVSAAAAGDLSKRIETGDKTGFFKTLGEGMNTLVGAVASAVGEVAGMMAAMAHGDLSKRISGDYQGAFLKLKQDANNTAEKLAEIAGQTVEGMTNIKASTTEISTGATDLSSRTEEQVASLEEIAASIRQLNTTVQQSSENAGQASQLAIAARTAAESGGEVASAAVTAMGEIEQSSQKISEIVGMIDEIAFQTNLLALNAAVEAARAGEAGRGFAVVAGEVRALAQRSSQASKDIKSLILNSSSQVKQGVELVNKAGTTLGEIVTSVKRVSDIVAEIAAANKEQSASVGEVQEAIGQIEQATQQNAALVEETTAALGSADNQVQSVTDVITFFKIDTAAQPARAANTSAPAKGAKAVQAKLAAKVATKPSVSPTKSSGGKKVAATGTDDGWEEF
jgi:methyl-accepting chemotaxis protein